MRPNTIIQLHINYVIHRSNNIENTYCSYDKYLEAYRATLYILKYS